MTTRTLRTLGMGLVASSLLLALPAAAQSGGLGGDGGRGGSGGSGNAPGCRCSLGQSDTSQSAGGALAALAMAAGVGTVVARARRGRK